MANVTLLVAIGLVFSIVTIPAFAQGPFHIIYPPQFTESDRIGSVSEEFSFQFTTDIGDPLDNIWAAISPNCALGSDAIDDTGLFTWVPTSVDMDKTCTINIILLADQTNLSARTFALVVNAAPMNDVAVITEYNVDVKENQEIPSLSTVVTNPADSQSAITPTYRITSGNLPQSVMDSLDASTGEFSASFPFDTVTGSQNSSTFTFTWTYDDDVEESEPQDAIITVNPNNRAPVIDPHHFSVPATRLTVDESPTLGLTGSDPDGDVVLWSIVSPVDGAEIDVDTGAFSFTSTPDHVGTSITFEFLLTDINGAQSLPLVRVFDIDDYIPWLNIHITPVSLPSGVETAHPLSPSTNPNDLDWEILSVLQSNDVIENPGITISNSGYLTWNPPHALIGELFIVNVKASESRYYRAALAPLNVHVFDNAKPVISFITPLASDSSTGTRADFVQVTDNNPNAEPAVVCIREDGSSITNGDLLLFGSNTITCTATDRASNKTVLTGTVLVSHLNLVLPSDIIVEATDVLTVVDIGNAIVTGGADSVTITNNAPDSFPLGNTVVTWTASARSENIASDTQSVTVEDTTKPVFDTFPDDVVVTSANRFVVNFENPTVTEIFPVTVLCDYKSGYAFFSGRTPVTCSAIDINDNFVSDYFYVTVNPP